MNLEQAATLSTLKQGSMKLKPQTRTKVQVARRVFQLAAQGGFPYKYQTPEKWAKKWLSSKEFVLMEIDINAAASPRKPKNPARVSYYMNCSKESMDPIVVDLNKRKVGMSHLGYIPEVVKLDGKHRSQALLAQGHTKVLAWVGCKAAKKLPLGKTIYASNGKHVYLPPVDNTRIAAAYEIYATTIPSVNIPTVKQDVGEGGSRPKDHVHGGGPGSGRRPSGQGEDITKRHGTSETSTALSRHGYSFKGRTGNNQDAYVKKSANGSHGVWISPNNHWEYTNSQDPGATKRGTDGWSLFTRLNKVHGHPGINSAKVEECNACGARSSGSFANEVDPSDAKIPPDASDAGTSVESSDRLQWDGKKANLQAPGTKPGYTDQFGSPNFQAPGAGSGPRVTNKGASNSEFSRAIRAGGMKARKFIERIYQKYKAACKAGWKPPKGMDAKAAPGWEGSVKEMKKHSDIDNPWALSHWMDEQGYTPHKA